MYDILGRVIVSMLTLLGLGWMGHYFGGPVGTVVALLAGVWAVKVSVWETRN